MKHDTKWPKWFPELSADQKWISDDFMKYWHSFLPKKYKLIEKFNNNYVVNNSQPGFKSLCGIGLTPSP